MASDQLTEAAKWLRDIIERHGMDDNERDLARIDAQWALCDAVNAQENVTPPIPSGSLAAKIEAVVRWAELNQQSGDGIQAMNEAIREMHKHFLALTASPSPLIDVAEVEAVYKRARKATENPSGVVSTMLAARLCDTIASLLIELDRLRMVAGGEE